MPVEVAFVYAEAVLDCIPVAAVLTDRAGKIRVANAPARLTLAERDGLQDNTGQLQAVERCADVALNEASRDCLVGKQQLIRIPRRGASYWLLKIRPLNAEPAPEAMHMVAWIDPHCPPSLDGRILENLFGLSPAEVRLAIHLATGDDLACASSRLGISQDTARSHLKATFRKMGLHRQQDLIRTATMLSYFH